MNHILILKIYFRNSSLKMEYITNKDKIIFEPEFNRKLDFDLISGYTNLIFSNHILNDRLFESYSNNIFIDCSDLGRIILI